MRNGEKGQALPIVLILVAFGGLVMAPFLGQASSSLIGSRIYGTAISEQYSSDAGVEQAIWDLTYDDLADQLTYPGDSTSYQLGEAINGIAPDITVSMDWEAIASDNFESGGWAGGIGWLDDWSPSGEASVTMDEDPYEGSQHLLLMANTGYVKRAVDLSSLYSARLQFWAKARLFEGDEKAYCLISSDGSEWTTVHTWAVPDDDNIYRFYDIDLSSYELTSEFWIAFKADMGETSDYFYVDGLKVVWAFGTVGPVASDNFNSGGWAGGIGWLDDWSPSGEASVTMDDDPYEGSHHLLLMANTGYVERAVDLSGLSGARLQFWAKARLFEGNEKAYCLISSNGTDWTTVHTWAVPDDDNIYRFYDIDLSSYELTSEFWIAFEAGMQQTSDYFYVDDLKVKGAPVYGIASVSGNQTIRAVVQVVGETVSVLWWRVT